MEKPRIAAKQPAVLSLDREPTIGVNVDARGINRSVMVHSRTGIEAG